jgi:hypothetical protein
LPATVPHDARRPSAERQLHAYRTRLYTETMGLRDALEQEFVAGVRAGPAAGRYQHLSPHERAGGGKGLPSRAGHCAARVSHPFTPLALPHAAA